MSIDGSSHSYILHGHGGVFMVPFSTRGRQSCWGQYMERDGYQYFVWVELLSRGNVLYRRLAQDDQTELK